VPVYIIYKISATLMKPAVLQEDVAIRYQQPAVTATFFVGGICRCCYVIDEDKSAVTATFFDRVYADVAM
jgi:hypothetical protein